MGEEDARLAAEVEAKAIAAAEELRQKKIEEEVKTTAHMSTNAQASLRSFMSESTGAIPRSHGSSANSSVGPDDINSDHFSLQEDETSLNIFYKNKLRRAEHRSRAESAPTDFSSSKLIATGTHTRAVVPPQPSPVIAKQTNPTPSLRAAHQSAISHTNNSSASQKSLQSQLLAQSCSTTTTPTTPQHSQISTATTPHTNFGRKRYDDTNVSFSFSLLSTFKRAPASGKYASPHEEDMMDELGEAYKKQENDMLIQSKSDLLNKVMDRFSIAVRQTRLTSGILMEAGCTAYPLSVHIDDTNSFSKRSGLVCNLVRAAIPIISVRGDTEGLKTSERVIRSILQKTIDDGHFKNVR